jgi:hypothetical protein
MTQQRARHSREERMSRMCAVHKFEWLNSETAWMRMKPQCRQRHRIEAVPPLPAASFFGRQRGHLHFLDRRPSHSQSSTISHHIMHHTVRASHRGSHPRAAAFVVPLLRLLHCRGSKQACCCWWIAQHSRHAQLVRHRGIVARIAKAIRGLHCAD